MTWRQTLFFVALFSGVVRADTLRSLNPHAARDAFLFKEFSLWSGILNVSYGSWLSVEADSSPLRDYQIKLNDGVLGSAEDLPGSFALFDGARAHLKYNFPDYFKLYSLRLQSLEAEGQALPRVRLSHVSGAQKRELALERRVVAKRGGIHIVEYALPNLPRPLEGGRLDFVYDNSPLEAVFLDEFVFNGLGLGRVPPNEPFPQNLASWIATHGAAETARVERFLPRARNEREKLKILLGHPQAYHPTRLVYLNKLHDPRKDYTLYSFILKVDQTGHYILDTVRGNLLLPKRARGKVPLMLLNHQGTVYGMDEPMGFMGRKELAFAEELAAAGIASLAVDSVVNNGIASVSANWVYHYHPHWSALAKDWDNVKRSLEFAVGTDFSRESGVQFDAAKTGVMGFSYGALLSLLAGLYGQNFSFVGVSHLEDYSQDWKSFAHALYLPQLAQFPEGRIPLHVCRLLQGIGKGTQVLAVLGDAALTAHYKECLSPHDKHIEVKTNPSGKTLTMAERAHYLNAIFARFGVKAKANVFAPVAPLDQDLEGAVRRENAWRELFQRKLTQ